MSDNPAGWQPDPSGRHDHRYWDGTQWTDHVSDAGVASTDPFDAAPSDVSPDAPTAVTPVPGDDTTSFPQPAPPPPYVPPSPVLDPDGDGSGGSKRGLLIGGAILAVVAIAVIAFLALGGDDDPDVREQLASAIEDDPDSDVSSSEAACISDLIVDEAGEDAFDGTDFDADDPPQAFIEAAQAVGLEAFIDECGVDESAFGGGGSDEPTDDGGEEPSDDGGEEPTDSATDTPSAGDFEDEIADVYAETFGISEEKARCLAERITEAVEGGQLDEEEAMSEIFGYLADCDISMEEISGATTG